MNEKSLKVLEYPKIIQLLVEYASTPLGKDLCRNLVPSESYEEILRLQKETSDAVTRVYQKGSISFSGARDIRDSLKRLHIGSSLTAGELLNIHAVLTSAARAVAYGKKDDPEAERDSLDDLFDGLSPLAGLNHEIDRCILSEEEIADDASPGLHSVRRNMRLTKDRIHTQMNSIMNASRSSLQDGLITMRNGRYCLPVKMEHKAQVPGMVHDQSATGSTLFIEPMAIVKLNNDLRELEIKEHKEIEAVLAALSNSCGEHTEELEDNLKILSELDFIFARAALSRHMKASEPKFNTKGKIRIKKGRHPLLPADKVVPIDIHLGDTFDQLIVTGPNTGGKTVSIKTVGLLTLMGQAGLHIPAFDNSELAVFQDVYADIGDEQSIEQSLSTFSSHMTNIVSFLEKADQNSLVLFDELCSGTDPTEGAALAISILTFLHNMKVRTMATTHYSELKVFALTTEGVENACCEFDVDTLSPTYRLLIGIPGKSNAFAISRKLGLPEFIINDAKNQMDAQDVSFEDMMTNLENSRVTIEKERESIAAYKQEVAALKEKLKAKEQRMDARTEKIIRDANEKAQAILAEAKETADQVIKNLNKKGMAGNTREIEANRGKLRDQLNKVNSNLALKPTKKKEHTPPQADKLMIGDGVRVLSMNLNGTVSSLPNQKGDLYVQMGILRSLVNIRDIELLQEETVTGPSTLQKSSASGIKMSKSANISPEINLIGKTVDEAMSLLDKYLDDAYLAHLPKVRVVHGRGTGALRQGVHSLLRKTKYVKSYHLGEFGEGDTGVTIVEFK